MITVSEVNVSFGGQVLFKDVDLKFTNGNCYGVIGANGAGKSTFLKVLCGELEPTKGTVTRPPEMRMSVLRQDHYAFDEFTVQDTVIMGNKKLYDIMQERTRSTLRRTSRTRTASAQAFLKRNSPS